jgi:hypothetical protein
LSLQDLNFDPFFSYKTGANSGATCGGKASVTGTPFAIPFAAEIAFQVTGTFGAATVTLQGSNDGTNWHPLTRKGAGTNNLAFTSANLQNAWENPAYIRAISSGGTGTAVNAIVCLKANFNKVGY